MMTKFWRRLHLFSTLFAGIFILICTITGVVLAVEPYFLKKNSVSGTINKEVKLVDFQKKIENEFLEIFSIEIDDYQNIKIEGIANDGEGSMFVNSEYKIVSPPKKTGDFFDFCRDLHRSLFLKTTGRILVGIAALAMLFLSISGIFLQIKRVGNWWKIFNKIKNTDIKRDNHAQWSRWFIIPIFIIAFSGFYLSMARFLPKNKHSISQKNTIKSKVYNYNDLTLFEIKKINFPVEVGENYEVVLKNKSLYFDSETKKLLEIKHQSLSQSFININYFLHTATGSPIYGFLLGISCLVVLFLIFTGMQMIFVKFRLKKSQINAQNNSEILILIASETGNTWKFANALKKSFINEGKSVQTIEFQNYNQEISAKEIYFLCSTYGDGNAPENAFDFIEKLKTYKFSKPTKYAVLGFGSRQYPKFCAYAFQLQTSLQKHENLIEILPISCINNQSAVEFIDWIKKVNATQKYNLIIENTDLQTKRKKNLVQFRIIEKKFHNDTFLIKIESTKSQNLDSGDLLGVYPPNENIERFYSVAKLGGNQYLLMIKRSGKCSNYLCNINENEGFEAYIKVNPDFKTPKNKSFLCIANGTGIAPFLGLQNENSRIFWGGKTMEYFDLFSNYINLEQTKLAFSQEKANIYVQDLVIKNEKKITELLYNNEVILICGSVKMRDGVISELEKIITKNNLPTISDMKTEGRLLLDCY